MKIFFSDKCLDYSLPGHPESPERVRSTYKHLRKKGFELLKPSPCDDKDILLAHTQKLLDEVKGEKFFDFDTPALPGIYEHARLAAGSAINAAELCLKGEMTFSLMRPPGHHATQNILGGFCYFNNIAIASLKLKESAGKVAIIDFDCHHGNGTEDIFFGKKDFLYLSLHQSPLYPGTGTESRGNCLNYPVAPRTSPEKYLSILEKGLNQVKEFEPGLLAVSAGFDSYVLDPITSLSLEKITYRKIGSMLARLGKPLFSVLEGGYSRDIPECIEQFLIGLDSKA
jgi:acetoin utilization deacetylase AcuC-like enzyme